MVNFQQRSLKRRLGTANYPNALEELRSLDLFAHDEERLVRLVAGYPTPNTNAFFRKLRNTGVLLLAAIAKACPVKRPSRNMVCTMYKQSRDKFSYNSEGL
jgi:hypothetical protein